MRIANRLLLILGSALVAHVIASYVCLYFTLDRIADQIINSASSFGVNIPHEYKVFAPLHIFQILVTWAGGGHDTTKGLIFLWACYLVPFAVILVLGLMVPKWMFIEDGRKRC
jgi:hypothetical protein